MGIDPTVLPDAFLSKMDKADRKRLGMEQSVKEVDGGVQIDFSSRPNTDEEKLNKTERAYLWHLRKLNVPKLRIQQFTLKLADDCRLTADFTYVNANGRMVFVDVKGWQREDALIKMKMAARQFDEFDFVIVKRDGAGWEETPVAP